MKISIVIPALNEEGIVGKTVRFCSSGRIGKKRTRNRNSGC